MAYCLLFIAYCSLLIIYCLLLIAYCLREALSTRFRLSLPIAHALLLTAYGKHCQRSFDFLCRWPANHALQCKIQSRSNHVFANHVHLRIMDTGASQCRARAPHIEFGTAKHFYLFIYIYIYIIQYKRGWKSIMLGIWVGQGPRRPVQKMGLRTPTHKNGIRSGPWPPPRPPKPSSSPSTSLGPKRAWGVRASVSEKHTQKKME